MDTRAYTALSRFYKSKYGIRVSKISIDGGFTCPNRDGTLDTRGCIFCSDEGSGDFAIHPNEVPQRIESLLSQGTAGAFILYLQAYTNTYDSVDNLRILYQSLIDSTKAYPVVGINIATRPDCLNEEIIELLKDLMVQTDVYIELGLQTIHKQSTAFIRRYYSLAVYDEAVKMLNNANIPIITHIILGLPGESHKQILDTVSYVANSGIHGIKLQLLHIIKGTDLETFYKSSNFHVLAQEEYVDLVIDCLELLPKDIIIYRLTGDGNKDTLIAPLWSLNKRQVINDIWRRMKERNTYQGKGLETLG